MDQNQKSVDGPLEKIAMIVDAIQNVYSNSQSAIVFELEENDFNSTKAYFRQIDPKSWRFKIDISGVEVIFMLKGYEPPKVEEKKEEVSKFKKILNLISGKKSS
jgi:hypothetical protein